MTNFGWVPRPSAPEPPDDYLDRLEMLVARRPDMEMIEIVSTIHDFIEEADQRAAPPPPIDELVIGGHASRQSWTIDPFSGASQTDFESLEASMAAAFRSIKIPDALISFDPADPRPAARAFHVKGCSIGTSEPWLVKLREALGDHVRVTAPKHFHGISNIGTATSPTIEIIEWMAYEIIVFQKTPFPNLDALAAAFHAKGIVRPDGSPITLGSYKAWLRTMRVRRYDRAALVQRRSVRMPLGVTIGGLRYAEGETGFYIRTPTNSEVLHTVQVPPPAVIPTTDAGREAMLATWLPIDPIFRDTHPFPWFKRIGYATLADMIAGLRWRFVVDDTASPPTVECVGGRFEYGLLIPIANPGAGGTLNPTRARLIFNHVPESGPPTTAPAFDETDAYFYETVP